MLKIMFTNRMKRDVKRMKKRGKDLAKLTTYQGRFFSFIFRFVS